MAVELRANTTGQSDRAADARQCQIAHEASKTPDSLPKPVTAGRLCSACPIFGRNTPVSYFDPEPLYTPQQVADRYGCKSLGSLANARSLGHGPRWLRLPNGRVRYPLSDLLAWEQASTRPPTPAADAASGVAKAA